MSAAILAGGRASRFGGRDKGALVVDGRSILERQIGELSRLTDDIMVVGDRVTASWPSWRREEVCPRAVPGRIPGSGPLSGLDAALAAARDDAVVLVACDMPFVTTAFLAHLLDRLDGFDAVVPRTARGYHPLCAAYSRACAPVGARRLAKGQLKALDLLEDVRVRAVTEDEIAALGAGDRLLVNINTPVEYDEIAARLGHKR